MWTRHSWRTHGCRRTSTRRGDSRRARRSRRQPHPIRPERSSPRHDDGRMDTLTDIPSSGLGRNCRSSWSSPRRSQRDHVGVGNTFATSTAFLTSREPAGHGFVAGCPGSGNYVPAVARRSHGRSRSGGGGRSEGLASARADGARPRWPGMDARWPAAGLPTYPDCGANAGTRLCRLARCTASAT